jgi:hypothetical protein
LFADFVAGRTDQPAVPARVAAHLTTTVDGLWVVWAQKVARRARGDRFVPMIGGTSYPTDAVASCRAETLLDDVHKAPEPSCRCGFHALSSLDLLGPLHRGPVTLTVVLSGRVLAYKWHGGGVLWRAERQTVIRVESSVDLDDFLDRDERGPGDPDGRTVAVPTRQPHGSGPVRIALPVQRPPAVACHDDAGWCAAGLPTQGHQPLLVHA